MLITQIVSAFCDPVVVADSLCHKIFEQELKDPFRGQPLSLAAGGSLLSLKSTRAKRLNTTNIY